MNNDEKERIIEELKLKTLLVPCGIADNLWKEALALVEELQTENTTLHKRLENTVEFPFKVGATVYTIHKTDTEDEPNPWIDTGKVVSFSFDGKLWIFVRYNSGLTMWYTKDTFDKEVYITCEAAESHLAN